MSPLLLVRLLFLCSCLSFLPLGFSQASSKWQTLSGNPPLVVARGGVSGVLPDSSSNAFLLATLISVPDVILWCDVQLTKTGSAICGPSVDLSNFTTINKVFPKGSSSYVINGIPTKGWYSVDFTDKQLANVAIIQGIYSRTPNFDGDGYAVQHVEDVASQFSKNGLWLNFQHDGFFTQHKLNATRYVLSVAKNFSVSYISSPEVAFLKGISSAFKSSETKLVFRFLELNDVEPTTNQTYSSLLKNLSFIKSFASGILVPKSFIWPVDANYYLKPHTSLVSDGHKAGLEVFASDFYNDFPLSYNYSQDPDNEILYYINNGEFSVDGVLSDFPATPSIARDCLSHMGRTAPDRATFTIITKDGASGDFPGATDSSYERAINDGANFIDCSVQISADRIPFCMPAINLANGSNVLQSTFNNLADNVPELGGLGVYAFALNWSQIQTLTPVISNPYSASLLYRNPLYKNAGKFLTLADFLSLAKNSSSLSGVLISIENSPYLTTEKKIPVESIVRDALNSSGYDKKVMIQSSDSSLLKNFKSTDYELVYLVGTEIGDATPAAISDIKSFAHSVLVSKSSIISEYNSFLDSITAIGPKLQAANLSVYAKTFSNEFLSQAWDFFSDATIEINNYVFTGINGIVTDFPRTAARYKKSRCYNSSDLMMPVKPGQLLQLALQQAQPPALAPLRELTVDDVAEPPLPPANEITPAQAPSELAKKSGAQTLLRVGSVAVSWLSILGSSIFLM